jgi:phosphatidate cytidylyltransferase
MLHIAAPIYLGLWGGMSFALFEHGQGFGPCAKFIVVMTILWACDAAAYFAGRFLGKHKLAPQISPKKTWEGAIGGTLFAMFWFWIWSGTGFGVDVFKFSLPVAMAFAFVVSAAGQLGDLLISALKRWSGAKDSSEIFPGHGGVLDRTDSFYFAVPIAVILLSYLSK